MYKYLFIALLLTPGFSKASGCGGPFELLKESIVTSAGEFHAKVVCDEKCALSVYKAGFGDHEAHTLYPESNVTLKDQDLGRIEMQIFRQRWETDCGVERTIYVIGADVNGVRFRGEPNLP